MFARAGVTGSTGIDPGFYSPYARADAVDVADLFGLRPLFVAGTVVYERCTEFFFFSFFSDFGARGLLAVKAPTYAMRTGKGAWIFGYP